METIRLTEKAKTQLTTLKRRTGIKNWNTLCRWAFCYSLRDDSEPPKEDINKYSNVEMSWRTFGGPQESLYRALLVYRKAMAPRSYQNLTEHEYFSMHVNRGIARLLHDVKETKDLVGLIVSTEDSA